MKTSKLFNIIVLLLLVQFSSFKLQAQAPFEGIIKTRVSVAGVDLNAITENIDYSKGNIQEQIAELYQKLPKESAQKLQSTMQQKPMLGLAILMTPPQAYLYLKDQAVVARIKGLGYEIQHYHNLKTDEAYIHSASLVDPSQAITSRYTPSKGYAGLFTPDKIISEELFKLDRSDTKIKIIAGHECNKAIYTAKSLAENSLAGTEQLYKLIVYTSHNLPKDINFSHPYYLPEDRGIMRIDIYLDNSNEATMVYEVVSVEKTNVKPELLQIKKTTPMYQLTDMEYSMKLLGVMMGGLSSLSNGSDDFGDDDDEEVN